MRTPLIVVATASCTRENVSEERASLQHKLTFHEMKILRCVHSNKEGPGETRTEHGLDLQLLEGLAQRQDVTCDHD